MTLSEDHPTPPIVDERIGALWRHWLAMRHGTRMPARRAIDPTAIPATLPLLYIYDFEAATGRFYCRLAGEEIQLGSGVRGVRRYLDELFPTDVAEPISRRYRRVVETPCIVYVNGLMRTIMGVVMPVERLVLPLSDDGVSATGLIGATIYYRDQAVGLLDERKPTLAEERHLPLPAAD